MSKGKYSPPWKRVARIQTLGQLLADFFVIFSLCVGTVRFFHVLNLNRFAALEIAAIVMLSFWIVGLYRRERSIMNILETQKLCRAVVFIFLILGLFFIRKPGIHTLFEIAGFAICVFVIIETERYLFFKLDQRLLLKGIGWEKVIIYDNEETGRFLVERMLRFPKFGKLPVGFLVDKKQDKRPGEKVPVLGHIDGDLEKVFEVNRIDTVIVARQGSSFDILLSLEQACRKLGIKLEFESYLWGPQFKRMRVDNVRGVSLTGVLENAGTLLPHVLKRAIDVCFSVLILLITSPLFAVVIFLTKRDSRGAAIFKQKRAGENGQLFTMFKFRTMHPRVDEYDYHPRDRNDERVTRLGRILRRTSLDELPQLFNVIKGEMSLVGPRPEMPFIVKKYDVTEKQRLLVKPGITGLWQISADRSRAIHENIDYDLYYVRNQSLLLDIAILLRTAIPVVRGLGAF